MNIDLHASRFDWAGPSIEVTALLGPLPPDTDSDVVAWRAEAFTAVGVQTVMVGAVGAGPARWLEETSPQRSSGCARSPRDEIPGTAVHRYLT
jgi:hypothetical protein